MDAAPAPDEIGDGLGVELRARVKSELEPGERLLWVATACPGPGRTSKGYLAWCLVALASSVVDGFSWAEIFRNPLREIGGRLFLGLCLGIVGLFAVLGLFFNRKHKRSVRVRLANTLYALTERRAIIRSPELSSGAVKVVIIPRGSVSGVYRVEYPDGSGDVLLKARAQDFQYGDEYWGPCGFRGVAEVRRVAEQVRRTLVDSIVPPAGT